MRSTFFGLNIALLGLQTQRKALDVSAHNVANANTEGYSRQEALMAPTLPYTVPAANRLVEAGQTGTGVEVTMVRRMRDSFLDYQIRCQTSTLGNWETTRDTLEEIEAVFNEPSDSGISSLMSKMWGAWQDLSANPDSHAARAAVTENSGALADLLRRDAAQLDQLSQQVGQAIELKVDQVNGWLEELAALNGQIVTVQITGDEPNDLRDRRDLLLDNLAQAVRVSYEEQSDGSVTVWLGTDRTRALVEGSQSFSLGAPGEPLTAAEQALVEDGELRALLDTRDDVLDPSKAGSLAYRLRRLAETLIQEVNALHGSVEFFVGSDASDIAVNPALLSDPSLIQAGTSGEPGDGSNALLIAQLQTKQVTIDGQNTTLTEWYSALVTRLGIDSQQAKATASNQQLLVNHLKTNRESLSGVSLDEEAANMIRFERAYQAAARVITVMDEMLDTLINGMGTAGR